VSSFSAVRTASRLPSILIRFFRPFSLPIRVCADAS
jgi:hypothetical protein